VSWEVLLLEAAFDGTLALSTFALEEFKLGWLYPPFVRPKSLARTGQREFGKSVPQPASPPVIAASVCGNDCSIVTAIFFSKWQCGCYTITNIPV